MFPEIETKKQTRWEELRQKWFSFDLLDAYEQLSSEYDDAREILHVATGVIF